MDNIIKMVPTLNPEALLFKELRENPPKWWTNLVNDPEVYIEIRKENKIHAYYYGARIAEITFKNGEFLATCNSKYINGEKASQNKYDSCIHMLGNKRDLLILKRNALKYYVGRNKENGEDIEDTSEKRLQGRLRIDNVRRYIDSEFEYGDSLRGDSHTAIRFDLVAVDGNIIKIEELKRIGDNRLRTSNMELNPPEVLAQMDRYAKFMSVNEDALCAYYQTLIEIKDGLGLPIPMDYDKNKPLRLDLTPLLIIKNLYRYSKMNVARFDRIKDIRKILEKNNIKYYILP